jgi:hypothetical protein
VEVQEIERNKYGHLKTFRRKRSILQLKFDWETEENFWNTVPEGIWALDLENFKPKKEELEKAKYQFREALQVQKTIESLNFDYESLTQLFQYVKKGHITPERCAGEIMDLAFDYGLTFQYANPDPQSFLQ